MAVETRRSRSGGGRTKRSQARPTRKALTIGAVCKILGREFEDVSISKIRYLEDRKLLSPRRTSGGYRLYSQADVERLRTILRLQRDEFLPLRVIRQELASGRDLADRAARGERGSRNGVGVEPGGGDALSREQLIEASGAESALVAELEEFGILEPRSDGDGYEELDVELVRAANELARFGVAARNLRVFRSSAERESSLLEQILGPALRARNPARRKEAVENLESLAAICTRLTQLLLVRRLRELSGRD